ncbi:calpain-5-like [Physella acuta]|uniref:calpain-5-like n=1 Tax=Physella acuta TaxID=109671 RepID=UPI0027DD48ED|nr:calpain-5-like [Physella acuta]
MANGDKKPQLFREQNYAELRAHCLSTGILFKDPEFPPIISSLCFNNTDKGIEWKRPREIIRNPKFVFGTVKTENISQGNLGNCTFVAACVSVCHDRQLWENVVPDSKKQVFYPALAYAGIFHFKIWSFGQWMDVVIDDYLPTRGGRLIFTHSKSGDEFWAALLEKAYAKFIGCYQALISRCPEDVMVDLTGGVAESLEVKVGTDQQKQDLFDSLLKARSSQSIICASIHKDICGATEKRVGLVRNHAYSITDVRHLPLKTTGKMAMFIVKTIPMVRLRNPWGKTEWTGAWSDRMCFDDFTRYFTDITTCHILTHGANSCWREIVVWGDWRSPDRAGGCENYFSFLDNPQVNVFGV